MSNDKAFRHGLTREKFDSIMEGASDELKELIWQEIKSPTDTSLDIVDYSSECSMCGVEMAYRYCGMCPRCEMVWNS